MSQAAVENLAKAIHPPCEGSDRPMFSIRSGHNSIMSHLQELWAYRELLYFLTWRNIKVRYKQTFLGIAWAIIQPLFMMIVFTIIFSRIAGIPSDGIPYPIFVFAGLLPWIFVSNALSSSSNSLVGNPSLVSKIYFPRIIIPSSTVIACLVDFAIGSVFLCVLLLYYGIVLTWNIMVLPILIVLVFSLVLGLGILMASLNVKYRDIRYMLPFLIQLWMFITPIIYPMTAVKSHWKWVLVLNPLTGIIQGFRAALFGLQLDWTALAISSVTIIMILAFSLCAYRLMERDFADYI